MKTPPAWPSLEEARSHLERGRGRGIKIAVLDSGIETSHPSLNSLTLADDVELIDNSLTISSVTGNGMDVFGHGTAIADIIHQIAPEAQIGSFRVLSDQLRSRTLIIREGARLALKKGYHILNCSFGCGREDHVLQYKDWVDAAYMLGRHIVASCNNQDYLKREWPGYFPSVITATFTHNEEPMSFFSRRGCLVEFGARGQDLEVAWRDGSKKKVTGSSFATPHIAGLLARLLSAVPDLSPLQAKALLQDLAAPWPA